MRSVSHDSNLVTQSWLNRIFETLMYFDVITGSLTYTSLLTLVCTMCLSAQSVPASVPDCAL